MQMNHLPYLLMIILFVTNVVWKHNKLWVVQPHFEYKSIQFLTKMILRFKWGTHTSLQIESVTITLSHTSIIYVSL